MHPDVIVIGGGLAGLAAALRLGQAGRRVTVLESRQRLGGRAGSFVDLATGQMIDACQHVSMGCCTALASFCRDAGIEKYLEPQRSLFFLSPDGRVSQFKADPWPAPFHLGRALLGAHYLTATEKLRIIYGMVRLVLTDADADPPLLPWLRRHKQTQRTIDRFWGVVLTSALNETVERVGRKYARKVFVDGFLKTRDGFTVEVPTVPLGKLYGEELRTTLTNHGVTIRENAGVKWIAVAGDSVTQLELRDGTTMTAETYIVAVPFDRLADILPPEIAAREPFALAAKLQPSPITSVHLWYDRPLTPLPHVVFVDCLGQWLFNRGETSPGEHYAQVVVSAARPLKGLGRDEVQSRIAAELRTLFPKTAAAKLLRAKVVTEHTATFSAVPGIDALRPHAATPIENLLLAGDWTATGWPATMEGAVISGNNAARAALTRAAA